ncbi:MAG: uridine kinase, partial [Pseudomonadota bacterium]
LQRRIARDVAERGRERDNVIAQFEQQVEPMHQRFVEPSARFADTVFDQDAHAGDDALEQMIRFCRDLSGVR